MDSSEPPKPETQHPTPKVLLIQVKWPARALVKADLEARGCDVLAGDAVGAAVESCLARGFRPEVVILDAADLDTDEDEVDRLRFLCGRSPILLLTTNRPLAGPLTNLLPKRILKRPFSIGNVGDAVIALARSEW